MTIESEKESSGHEGRHSKEEEKNKTCRKRALDQGRKQGMAGKGKIVKDGCKKDRSRCHARRHNKEETKHKMMNRA